MDGTIRLTCEFLHNPLGVQTAHPRFSWYSDEPKGMQAGWRIRVAASEEDLRGGPLLWDSGPVASGRCTAIPYEGHPLVAADPLPHRGGRTAGKRPRLV